MSLIDDLNADAFTILSQIGLDAVFAFNTDRKVLNIDCKLIVKGSTNLKYITPPHLLTDPDYFKSHPKLQAGDLDLLMVMDNSFNKDKVNEQILYFKNVIANLPTVTRFDKIGYGILQLENILSQYGFTIIIDDSIDELPNTPHSVVNASITALYTLSEILSDSSLIKFYTDNLIKRKQMLLQSVNKRKDNFFIKIMDKSDMNIYNLDLLETTFLINKRKKTEIISELYYPHVELVTPIYFMSEEWKKTHGGEVYSNFLYALGNSSIHPLENAAYLSLAYIIHELHRLYNYSFGPYWMEQYYWKRPQSIIRIQYVLKLIMNNQISRLYLQHDNTFMDEAHYVDLIKFLHNGFYDADTKPTGDPFYDFENDTPLINHTDLETADYNTTVANAEHMYTTSVIRESEPAIREFNTPTNKVGKAMLDYVISNNYYNEILSYTASSSSYSAGIFGYIYTGSDEFLRTKVSCRSGETTAVRFHQKFVNLFETLNSKVINKSFPKSYTLYKGVNLFNCRSSDGSYLKFANLDLTNNNYIFNPAVTSASSAMDVATRFVNGECCLLKISMKQKHKVYIVPDDDRVSSIQNEHEYIFPPNSVFKITNVQYVYRKQISHILDRPNTLVLIVDCEYLHEADGDIIVGLNKPTNEIPLGDAFEIVSSSELSNNDEVGIDVVPSIASLPPTSMQSLLDMHAKQVKPQYTGHKKSHSKKPHQHKSKGGAQGGSKKGGPAQAPAGAAAAIPTAPVPGSVLHQHKGGKSGKSGKHGKSKKPMSGGRLPITTTYRSHSILSTHEPLASARENLVKRQCLDTGLKTQCLRYRKLVEQLNILKPSKNTKYNIVSQPKAKIDSPVTYSVVFIDNLFKDNCCTSNASKSKMNRVTQKTMDEAYNTIQAAYAHPNAPNNKPLTPQIKARAKTIMDEHKLYMSVITDFVAKNPDYEWLLMETSLSKIKETYEAVIELQKTLSRKTGKHTSMSKAQQMYSLVSANRPIKQTKKREFRPLMIGREQLVSTAY